MKVSRIRIQNFRGIQFAEFCLPDHVVLIGDNNTGKTTVLEALNLVLGPDRLSRYPPINEHDFFRGKYLTKALTTEVSEQHAVEERGLSSEIEPGISGFSEEARSPRIEIEVVVTHLSDEQKAKFSDYIEFWDHSQNEFYTEPNPTGVDSKTMIEAFRVTFHGWYDIEEDEFEGNTYYSRTLSEYENPTLFTRKDKQVCGFLYLRSLRTGSRALSLERGSLLDVILRLKEIRPQIWETTLRQVSSITVANDPELGISPILESIATALKKYVPTEWGVGPSLRVSNLTREHLRQVITAFIATDGENHNAPFYRQGTGTINVLVLAMLSQIAEDKQSVIFAMEEPETAVPPYTQKRIVQEVRRLSNQCIFSSHSPYVLEEFDIDETIVLALDTHGTLKRQPIVLPENVKLKRYRQEFRTRFCEGLLSRRVLVAEGTTEASAFPVVCRRLETINSEVYSSLDALGVSTVDAGGDTNILGMVKLYRSLGKKVFVVCDKQEEEYKDQIEAHTDLLLMHNDEDFESMVVAGTTKTALQRFATKIDWPQHLSQKYPDPSAHTTEALTAYFEWAKGIGGIADFLAQCSESEMPEWLRNAAMDVKNNCAPPTETDNEIAPNFGDSSAF